MATRKPDSEVGPLGVWAYDTARLLGLSAEQVAQRAGVTEPTIRKIEGGSNRHPSRRVVYEMARYFREVAAQQGVAITDPPMADQAGSGIVTDPGSAELIAALTALVEELRAERRERADLLERVGALETAAKLRDQQDAEDAGTRPLPPVNAQ